MAGASCVCLEAMAMIDTIIVLAFAAAFLVVVYACLVVAGQSDDYTARLEAKRRKGENDSHEMQ